MTVGPLGHVQKVPLHVWLSFRTINFSRMKTCLLPGIMLLFIIERTTSVRSEKEVGVFVECLGHAPVNILL